MDSLLKRALLLLLLAVLAFPTGSALAQFRIVNQGKAGTDPWLVGFLTPQHIICDSGCGSAGSVLMADDTGNPTIPQSATFGMLFDGANWDRWRGDATNGGWVNIKASISLPVTGPLTDAQLRATPVVVSGTVTATGPLTDAQLRASAVPVSDTSSAINAGTLAATTTAAQVAANVAAVEVLVQNDPDNAVDVLCGNSSTQPIQLRPGDGLTLSVTNVNLIWCKTVSSTATVAYVAR